MECAVGLIWALQVFINSNINVTVYIIYIIHWASGRTLDFRDLHHLDGK